MVKRGEIKKRSIIVSGHATSISIETEFWDILTDIAAHKGVSINYLLSEIDVGRTNNLSSAARVYVLKYVISKGQKFDT
jgi:predicted DNA-binding ribbon-helix-helix protein